MGKKLTVERSIADFNVAFQGKKRLIEREHDDFLFALGEQWSQDDTQALERVGAKPFTDNRIAPNLFLLTGLERQNRTDFKAFPEGDEDSLEAEIASVLLKDSIKKSGFAYKSSEQFKDGITAGESHLELFLDNSESLVNGEPKWSKCDGNCLFPDPRSREYDFSDARFVYKLNLDMGAGDLINMFPDHAKAIERAATHGGSRLSILGDARDGGTRKTTEFSRDYPLSTSSIASSISSSGASDNEILKALEEPTFDLIERYYKKWVPRIFIGDTKTGKLTEVIGEKEAQQFIADYKQGVNPGDNPERFIIVRRHVPEIWYFAHTPAIDRPLADEKAWFYPKWKSYPFIPYFARFSTAPLHGDERHLLVQGLVHGVKGAQEKHNKAEMLILRHLNTSTNSGWLAEEDVWVDEQKVEQFGTTAGVNLYYKKGRQQPSRIEPVQLSRGHAELSAESAQSIKDQLGINADLLATRDSGSASGRAIALRQRQGLLMVQELFDNLSRTRILAGKLLLTQMGEIYDTETAMKVLGEAFLAKNFPPVSPISPETGQPEPATDEKTGLPSKFDREMAELAISQVLSGDLWRYDVSVGESVASDSQRLANSAEVKDIATTYPGIIPPEVLIANSQLPEAVKKDIVKAVQAAQTVQTGPTPSRKAPPTSPAALGKEAKI